jgi:hypothetical protein
MWLLLVHHYLCRTVTSPPLSPPYCFYSAFNSMKVASPWLTAWNIFSHIDKLIVAQIAEKFPVFCGICSSTAAVHVYCNFQQSSCTLQPFTSQQTFRRIICLLLLQFTCCPIVLGRFQQLLDWSAQKKCVVPRSYDVTCPMIPRHYVYYQWRQWPGGTVFTSPVRDLLCEI